MRKLVRLEDLISKEVSLYCNLIWSEVEYIEKRENWIELWDADCTTRSVLLIRRLYSEFSRFLYRIAEQWREHIGRTILRLKKPLPSDLYWLDMHHEHSTVWTAQDNPSHSANAISTAHQLLGPDKVEYQVGSTSSLATFQKPGQVSTCMPVTYGLIALKFVRTHARAPFRGPICSSTFFLLIAGR